MSEHKHTKGPWRFTEHSPYQFAICDSELTKAICFIPKFTNQADVDLILSAPSLLTEVERLKEINVWLAEALKKVHTVYGMYMNSSTNEMIDATLAKSQHPDERERFQREL